MKDRSNQSLWIGLVVLFALFVVATPLTILVQRRNIVPSKVAMERLAFAPRTVKVSKGATVTFENRDVTPHTVTAKDGSFDSDLIGPGKTFELTVERSVAIRCDIHPEMTGTIQVSG